MTTQLVPKQGDGRESSRIAGALHMFEQRTRKQYQLDMLERKLKNEVSRLDTDAFHLYMEASARMAQELGEQYHWKEGGRR